MKRSVWMIEYRSVTDPKKQWKPFTGQVFLTQLAADETHATWDGCYGIYEYRSVQYVPKS